MTYSNIIKLFIYNDRNSANGEKNVYPRSSSHIAGLDTHAHTLTQNALRYWQMNKHHSILFHFILFVFRL